MASILRPTCVPATLFLGFFAVETGAFSHKKDKDENCPCKDPMNPKGDTCYMPVCDPGYYKCCASCEMAPCVGLMPMVHSSRGILECIPCPSGYFCDGCDIFEKCPVYTMKRSDKTKPSVSPPQTKAKDECQSCVDGQEADLDHHHCVQEYTDVCNEKLLRRCVNSCEGADGTKNLTPCERMKCLMKCGKSWSPTCASVLSKRCLYLINPPPVKDPAKAEEDTEEWLVNCDVDCSGAATLAASRVLLAAVLVSALRLL